MDRAVAVFYHYLSNLTPEHQQIWNSKILSLNGHLKKLSGDYFLHPAYAKASAGGISFKTKYLTKMKEKEPTVK
jgi:hypothetical protein